MDQQLTFEPIHSAHAIESVAAHVRARRSVDAVTWGRIVEAADALATGLGMVVARDEDVDEDDDYVAMVEATERRYERDDGNGAMEVLSLTRREVSFVTTRYTRWARFADRALPTLGELAGIYGSNRQLLGARLTYDDRFVARGGPPELTEVLDRNSPFLPPGVFELAGAWRFDGRFEAAERSATAVRMVDQSVAFVPGETEGDPPSLSIRTAMTDLLTDDLPPEGAQGMPTSPSLADRFDAMHDALKAHLGRIITSGMVDRINLFPPV